MRWSFWKHDHEQLLAAFIRAEAKPRIEHAFFEHPDHPDAREWSDALDRW